MDSFWLVILIVNALGDYVLYTDFLQGQSNSGQMFDVVAVNPIIIDSFEIQISDPNIFVSVNIYKLKTFGSFIGHENNKSDWILILQQHNISVNFPGQLKLLDYLTTQNIIVPKLQRQAFYIEVIGSTIEYNEVNNLKTGDLLTSNEDIELYVGISNNNDFGNYSFNKPFQGRIYYVEIPCDNLILSNGMIILCWIYVTRYVYRLKIDINDISARVLTYGNVKSRHNICFQISSNFTCINPFVNISFQNIDYNYHNDHDRFNYLGIHYFKNEIYQPNLITRTCTSIDYNDTCDIKMCDSGTAILDDLIFYSNEIHRIHLFNGPNVTNTCMNVSMNVIFTINCQTFPPTLAPTKYPTLSTNIPTVDTEIPTESTLLPTISPSNNPTTEPTINPTINPSVEPTIMIRPNTTQGFVGTDYPTSIPTRTPITSDSTPNNMDTPTKFENQKILITLISVLAVTLVCVIICFSIVCIYKIRQYKSIIQSMTHSMSIQNNPNVQTTETEFETPPTLTIEQSMNICTYLIKHIYLAKTETDNIEMEPGIGKKTSINEGIESIDGLKIHSTLSMSENDTLYNIEGITKNETTTIGDGDV